MNETEERIKEIMDAISKVKVVRYFDIKPKYYPIACRLKLDLETILGTERIIKSTESNWRHVRTIITDDRKGVYLEMVDSPEIDQDNIKECLGTILKDKNKRLLSGMSFRIKGTLPEPMRFFKPKYSGWKLQNPKGLEKTKDMVLNHIAEIIIAIAMSDSQEGYNGQCWENANKDKVYESIYHQIKTYVQTGDLKLQKPDKIDITDMKQLPKPMVFMSDEMNGLVWKYSKFCSICGNRRNDCWCSEIDENITKDDMITGSCYSCYVERIKRGWTGEFNDKFPEKTCIYSLGEFLEYYTDEIKPDLYEVESEEKIKKIIKEWSKKHGEYFVAELKKEECDGEIYYSTQISIKKITAKQFDKIFKIISEWQECGDYEPDENVCSCPTW